MKRANLKCFFQHALTGIAGGALGGAALAVSTGQINPAEIAAAAFLGGITGGIVNAAAPNGGLPGAAAAGILSTVVGLAKGKGIGDGTEAIISDALGGAVPPSVAGIAVGSTLSGAAAATSDPASIPRTADSCSFQAALEVRG